MNPHEVRPSSKVPEGGGRPLAERVELLENALAEIQSLLRRVGEEAALARHAAGAPAREAARGELFANHPRPARRVEGLSFLIPAWNHAGFLADAVTDADATLRGLPPEQRGEILVLDDASSDETPAVLARLESGSSSLRTVRSPANLGVAGARDALLELCDRRYAFLLDADNRVDPAGARALYRAALAWRPAFAHGLVVMRGEGELHARSNEPLDRSVLERWSTDMLGLLDVERTLRLGGFSAHPELLTGFDQELFLRMARHGELLLFVPVLVGRYRISGVSHHRASLARDVSRQLLRRMYLQDGGPAETAVAVAHPEAGLLWASELALARYPGLAEPSAGLAAAVQSR